MGNSWNTTNDYLTNSLNVQTAVTQQYLPESFPALKVILDQLDNDAAKLSLESVVLINKSSGGILLRRFLDQIIEYSVLIKLLVTNLNTTKSDNVSVEAIVYKHSKSLKQFIDVFQQYDLYGTMSSMEHPMIIVHKTEINCANVLIMLRIH